MKSPPTTTAIRTLIRLRIPEVSLYGPEGVNPETRHVASGRRESGKYIQWMAPVSGQHYVVVWSPQGDIGPYTVTVTFLPNCRLLVAGYGPVIE